MEVENTWVHNGEVESLSPIALEELNTLSHSLLQNINNLQLLIDEMSLSSEASKILISIKKLKEKINNDIKSLKNLIHESNNYYSNHKDEKQFQKIKLQFEEILKIYENTNKKVNLKKKQEKKEQDKKEQVKEESVIQIQELNQELNLKRSDFKRMEIEKDIQLEKERNLQKLEQDMKELTSCYENLDDLVKEQGEALLSSSQQLENSREYVQTSTTNLKEANKKQNSNRCKLFLLVILIFLLLIGTGIVLFFAFLPK